MNKPRTLLIIATLLIVEGAAIVAFPSRIPRPVRAITAGIDLIAAAGLFIMARQRQKKGS